MKSKATIQRENYLAAFIFLQTFLAQNSKTKSLLAGIISYAKILIVMRESRVRNTSEKLWLELAATVFVGGIDDEKDISEKAVQHLRYDY